MKVLPVKVSIKVDHPLPSPVELKWLMALVPNLFGTMDWFHGRQFFQRPGVRWTVLG